MPPCLGLVVGANYLSVDIKLLSYSSMVDRRTEVKPFSWFQVMACSYCNHSKSSGREDECYSLATPYFVRGTEEGYQPPTRLTDEQRLRGCSKIKYDGRKIRADLFNVIPTDSALRSLPFDQVVDPDSTDLFSSQSDITAKLTSEELAAGKEWW